MTISTSASNGLVRGLQVRRATLSSTYCHQRDALCSHDERADRLMHALAQHSTILEILFSTLPES